MTNKCQVEKQKTILHALNNEKTALEDALKTARAATEDKCRILEKANTKITKLKTKLKKLESAFDVLEKEKCALEHEVNVKYRN